MAWGHRKGTSASRVLAALVPAVLCVAAEATSESVRTSLFTNEVRAVADVGSAVPESGIDEGSGRPPSRMARVDFDGLGGIRDGVLSGHAPSLRLDLLHGAEFEARMERSAPTASGYTLSGPINDVPFGRVVLVVNGERVAGRVFTPEGNYAIHTTGTIQTVERMDAEPWHCAAEGPGEGATGREGGTAPTSPRFGELGLVAGAAEGSAPKRGEGADAHSGAPVRAGPDDGGASASDDGDVVDVLVVYPSFARKIEGGYAPMLEIIDLDIATANEAYAASGADLRVALAAAVEVEYDWFLHERFSDDDNYFVWRRALGHLSGHGGRTSGRGSRAAGPPRGGLGADAPWRARSR